MNNERIEQRRKRAREIKKYGTVQKAVAAGALEQFQDISLSEAVVLGLVNQGVKNFVGIFGHGMTDVGEALRIYEEEGAVKTVNVRNEVEAAHIASMLKWKYNETSAVFTSIGPGALQATAGSLAALANGLGVYYLFGDETSHSEGPNMQQIPRREQELFLKLLSTFGPAYSLHTPEAVFTALKRGDAAVHGRTKQTPFYLLLPMNIQPKVMESCNLLELVEASEESKIVSVDAKCYEEAAKAIAQAARVTVKAGGGAKRVPAKVIEEFLEASDAVYVHGPQVPGLYPYSKERNMGVGGSKGSICGNYAMNESDLVVAVGARGVCQWDSSGTAFRNAKKIVNINCDYDDLAQYGNSVRIQGDAEEVLVRLTALLKKENKKVNPEWLKTCVEKKAEWEAYKQARYDHPVLMDEKRGESILTEPAAIKKAVDFADAHNCIKIFDAGDVQANGFQIVTDEKPGQTITDTGSSYMGFAVSSTLAFALAGGKDYPVAFTGDGSFMMNPQILIDAVEHGLKGMIVLFDNRRMGAITSLQYGQYDVEFKTDDGVVVDYVQMAESVKGVKGFYGGSTLEEFEKALEQAYAHDGLSLVHVPVYFGREEFGGLGTFGDWNVGNWCERVQKMKHTIGF
ncbi:thiamine pyrophosphate-binding protein [Blautia sp. An249]|uniref:thiamine pyrophosphate-dependent enzyme n=1 Tax=Blautia sp. An249 TaxID=1965603 RepID=UPI000B389B2F|nr:thiamine pyrophosphate-dependent enzyme [Blautia sp. An249]OUO79284.1 thiamine pyrophosphate-binding protein [Blautia sp. An249]